MQKRQMTSSIEENTAIVLHTGVHRDMMIGERERKEQGTQTDRQRDESDDEMHNFVASDDISEMVEMKQEQIISKKISDIKQYTKPQ